MRCGSRAASRDGDWTEGAGFTSAVFGIVVFDANAPTPQATARPNNRVPAAANVQTAFGRRSDAGRAVRQLTFHSALAAAATAPSPLPAASFSCDEPGIVGSSDNANRRSRHFGQP